MKQIKTLALLMPLAAALPAAPAAWAESTPPAPSAGAVHASPSPGLPAGVAAQSGNVMLTVAQLKTQLEMLDPAQRAKAMADKTALANFVRDRALNQAVLAEATGKGWDKNPAVQERAQQAYDNVVIQTYLGSLVPPDPNYPSDADLAKFYDANKDKLLVPKQFHLAQIVVLAPPGSTPQQDEAARRRATDLRAQAARPRTDFADLARKTSQEKSSAEKGGDVGFLSEERLLPVVRDAVAGLPDGGLTEPLRAPDGWHVVKVLGTKPPTPATLEQAKPQLVQTMRQLRGQAIVRAHLQQLTQSQPIEVNEAAVASLLAPAH